MLNKPEVSISRSSVKIPASLLKKFQAETAGIIFHGPVAGIIMIPDEILAQILQGEVGKNLAKDLSNGKLALLVVSKE
jgi:hypothetical protein